MMVERGILMLTNGDVASFGPNGESSSLSRNGRMDEWRAFANVVIGGGRYLV
jgi:hypothetical protein